MNYPNLNEERKLWKAGYKMIAGVDEAGRGPLAGPVVAAAVIIRPGVSIKKVKDSKKLTAKQRIEIYNLLASHPKVFFSIGRVSEKIIDRINIFKATKLAMKKALKNLKKKTDFLLIDGNFSINSEIPQKSIIKGDEKVYSCSLASIIAKVERDRIMDKMHKKYSCYGFDRHKGYGTKLHLEMLEKHGPSNIHRNSFNPVKKLVELNKNDSF